MPELTNLQKYIVCSLRLKDQHTTASDVEEKWAKGEPAFIDTRVRVGRGFLKLFDKANKEAEHAQV